MIDLMIERILNWITTFLGQRVLQPILIWEATR